MRCPICKTDMTPRENNKFFLRCENPKCFMHNVKAHMHKTRWERLDKQLFHFDRFYFLTKDLIKFLNKTVPKFIDISGDDIACHGLAQRLEAVEAEIKRHEENRMKEAQK